MRGIQCPRMLWLDKHRPECKIIPPAVREKLMLGNEFGDACMGIFGDFVEVREYYAGTTRPNKTRMAAKTQELLAAETPVICEAAFLDKEGNYCAVDLLRRDGENTYTLCEVKNTAELGEQLVQDAAYQTFLIRRMGLKIARVYLAYHGAEPYVLADITERVDAYAPWVAEHLPRLNAAKYQEEEIFCEMGEQCQQPYACWYTDYCRLAASGNLNRPRCAWCNGSNALYVAYHDLEWGVPCHEDRQLFELLLLEIFEAGLSWEIILNKRENFREAFAEFDPEKIAAFDAEKVAELMNDRGIVRNQLKIRAMIRNSQAFLRIQQEFGSFDQYIWGFTAGQTIVERDPTVTESPLSNRISRDLRKRGMDFVGSSIIYAYLQAIGIMDGHQPDCWKAK